MKQNIYEVEKNVEKILRGNSTGFLTNNVLTQVQRRLKKGSYQRFIPFEEAEKIILYSKKHPQVRLFKLGCFKNEELKHSAIMGSLFGLNITGEMFGDIVKFEQEFYVYLLDDISELVLENLRVVGNVPVTLEEVPLEYLNSFKREYEQHEIIVSSLRIDTIISRLIGCNRDTVYEKAKNQEIFINDKPIKKVSISLEPGDIFSIRRFGKFCFRKIIGNTKKDNYIIQIDKYI